MADVLEVLRFIAAQRRGASAPQVVPASSHTPHAGLSIALVWLKPYFVPHYIAVIIFSNLNLSSCGMFLAEIFRTYSGFDFLPLYEW